MVGYVVKKGEFKGMLGKQKNRVFELKMNSWTLTRVREIFDTIKNGFFSYSSKSGNLLNPQNDIVKKKVRRIRFDNPFASGTVKRLFLTSHAKNTSDFCQILVMN